MKSCWFLFLLFFFGVEVNGQINSKLIAANGMTFNCRLAGQPDGEPVILLHGWPETSHMWIPLMEKLAKQGYYCIAPNQRGYSIGARPKKKKSYALRLLVSDIIAVADTLGINQFHLIGHDWGSAVGWTVVTLHPKRVKSWSALSVPHVKAFGDAVNKDKEQRKKSGYMSFFQLRGIPEFVLKGGKCKKLREAWDKSSAEQVKDYLSVFCPTNSLRYTLHWYRANYRLLKKGKSDIPYGTIHHPTLLIWGNQDVAIGRLAQEWTKPYMKGPFKFVELDAGHWLMQEQTERVTHEILMHLKLNPL